MLTGGLHFPRIVFSFLKIKQISGFLNINTIYNMQLFHSFNLTMYSCTTMHTSTFKCVFLGSTSTCDSKNLKVGVRS